MFVILCIDFLKFFVLHSVQNEKFYVIDKCENTVFRHFQLSCGLYSCLIFYVFGDAKLFYFLVEAVGLHVELAHCLYGCLSSVCPVDTFLAEFFFVKRERLSAVVFSCALCDRYAFALSLKYHFSFKLGKSCKDSQHETALRS